jgi:hypothetical protein
MVSNTSFSGATCKTRIKLSTKLWSFLDTIYPLDVLPIVLFLKELRHQLKQFRYLYRPLFYPGVPVAFRVPVPVVFRVPVPVAFRVPVPVAPECMN